MKVGFKAANGPSAQICQQDARRVQDCRFSVTGTFCCGPAPVAAILQGEVNLKYDVPFVFAEVNADIIKWMVSGGEPVMSPAPADRPSHFQSLLLLRSFGIFSRNVSFSSQVEASGAKRKILHDTSSVGQNISTKAVDQNQRDDITHSYKYREGNDCTCEGTRPSEASSRPENMAAWCRSGNRPRREAADPLRTAPPQDLHLISLQAARGSGRSSEAPSGE